jgi:hypothetical protein
MPALAFASNFADGLLMISMRSSADAGRLSNPFCAPKPVSAVCLPSISTTTLSLPRTWTLPSCPIVTPGTVDIACSTEPPAWLMLSETVKVFLSIVPATASALAVTRTSPRVRASLSSRMAPRSRNALSSPTKTRYRMGW